MYHSLYSSNGNQMLTFDLNSIWKGGRSICLLNMILLRNFDDMISIHFQVEIPFCFLSTLSVFKTFVSHSLVRLLRKMFWLWILYSLAPFKRAINWRNVGMNGYFRSLSNWIICALAWIQWHEMLCRVLPLLLGVFVCAYIFFSLEFQVDLTELIQIWVILLSVATIYELFMINYLSLHIFYIQRKRIETILKYIIPFIAIVINGYSFLCFLFFFLLCSPSHFPFYLLKFVPSCSRHPIVY